MDRQSQKRTHFSTISLPEKETLDKAQVAEIFRDVRRRPQRPAWTGSSKRSPQAGPIMTPKELSSPNGQDKEHSMGVAGPTDVPESPLPDELPGRPLGRED